MNFPASETTNAPPKMCRLCWQPEHGTPACSTVGENLLRAYASAFRMTFKPYEGPDKPLRFEPEEYPLR